MDNYKQILRKYWGFSDFRPLQEDIIKSVLKGNDTLALLPTGGGKSITFQVPALTIEGICLVVTPLIALMKDQVDKLNNLNIKAYAIHSGYTFDEISVILDKCIYSDVKFLYISPERIHSDIFIEKLKNINVNLIAVDEAHCISQWGYNFRPSYLNIANLKKVLPNIPILALTATATPKVIIDIQDKLRFKKQNVLQSSFERKNLIYMVRKLEDKHQYIINILSKTKGSGIIYVRNRKKTREIAQILIKNSISAHFYHGGLDTVKRTERQNDWMNGKIKVMVATNAFGMGIDKPDVRFVIHYDIPDSIEEYFQEAGRAGRDTKKAYAVLLYSNIDLLQMEQRIKRNFPEIEYIKKVYQALCNYLKIPIGGGKGITYDFKISDFVSEYNLQVIQAYNSLKFLEKDGYIELIDEIDNPSRIHFIVNRDDLYKFQVANIAFDGFIKLILRSYTGLFTDFVKIDENTLAKRANINREQVYNFLIKLSKFGIIKYIPQKRTPLIVFTEERLNEKNLRISKENYQNNKQRYIEKINAVLDYVNNKSKCRSRYLLAYFGQKNTYKCGKCDICKSSNELELSKYEFDLILDEIKKNLNDKDYELDDLIKILTHTKQKCIKVIQWLFDNNKIKYNDSNELTWN